MNAVVDKVKPAINLTLSQKKVEEWINSQDLVGRNMRDLGLLSPEQYERGVHQLADFKLKIEADKDVADRAANDTEAAFTEAEQVDKISSDARKAREVDADDSMDELFAALENDSYDEDATYDDC